MQSVCNFGVCGKRATGVYDREPVCGEHMRVLRAAAADSRRHHEARFPLARAKRNPYASAAQRGWMHIHLPKIAAKWDREIRRKRRNPDDPFADAVIIHAYSRKQAIEDGELVDVTEWASNTKGFHGGFTTPVAITRALWNDIDRKPMPHMQDLRGRAHDVLWMASLAVRAGMRRGDISDSRRGGRVGFDVLLQVGRKRKHRLNVDLSPGDDGEPVVTIGYPQDF